MKIKIYTFSFIQRSQAQFKKVNVFTNLALLLKYTSLCNKTYKIDPTVTKVQIFTEHVHQSLCSGTSGFNNPNNNYSYGPGYRKAMKHEIIFHDSPK